MALLSKKGRHTCSPVCMTGKWVIFILLLVVSVAAIIGVYNTHVFITADASELRFGSSHGSLAIIAFAIAASACVKQLLGCLGPCEIHSK